MSAAAAELHEGKGMTPRGRSRISAEGRLRNRREEQIERRRRAKSKVCGGGALVRLHAATRDLIEGARDFFVESEDMYELVILDDVEARREYLEARIANLRTSLNGTRTIYAHYAIEDELAECELELYGLDAHKEHAAA